MEILEVAASAAALAVERQTLLEEGWGLREAIARREARVRQGQMVLAIAKGVRDPLFGLTSAIDAFGVSGGLEGEGDSRLVEIRNKAWRVNDRVQALLEFVNPNRDCLPRTLIVEDLLRLVIDAISENEGITVKASITTTTERAVERSHLLLALQDLFEHVMRQPLRGGEIRVRTSGLEGPEGPRLVIRVEGVPAPPRRGPVQLRSTPLPDLFLAEQVITKHGGRIVYLEPNEGGPGFELSLPASEKPTARPDGVDS